MSSGLTLHDIARQAKVSKSTVSRAINNMPGISSDTRTRVLAVCERMGFHINTNARALKTGGKNTIAVVLEEIRGFLSTEVIYGANQVARRRGFIPILLLAESGDPDGVTDFLNNISGVIYATGDTARRVRLPVSKWKIPTVCAVAICDDVPSVVIDDRQGGYIATKSLIDRGYRQVAVIMGPQDWLVSEERVRGYLDAIEGHCSPIIHYADWWTSSDGYKKAMEVLETRPEVNGFFAGDDHIAAGVISAARDVGKRVPQDIAVVGFNDSYVAVSVNPNIASVHVPLEEIGQRAAEILIDAIVGDAADLPPTERLQRIPCRLIERESLGLPQQTLRSLSG